MINKTVIIGFSVVWLLFAFRFGLYVILITRLSRKHPDEWEKLGRPGVVKNNNSRVQRRVQEFIDKGGNGDRHDELLDRTISIMKRFKLIWRTAGISLLVFVIYLVLKNKLNWF